MKKTLGVGLLVLLGILIFVGFNSYYTVHQTQQALVLQFGRVIGAVSEPGLHFKIPFVQNVEYFDRRILDLDSPAQEVIASDRKRLVVDAYSRYRIVNPLLFYQTIRTEAVARSRLSTVLNASLRRVLGESTFQAVVRDEREALMGRITDIMNVEAAKFGLLIVDTRIKRADLPEANSLAVYRRMQTERQREAADFRAQGEEQSRRVRANANREVTIIKAEATRDGEKLRGEGDAERNRIFADAFTRDPDFFAFYRAMQAYENGLNSGDTRLVLSPDSEFFRYFNDPLGKDRGAAGGQ